MAAAQKLSPVDASFLHLESRATHMHIGGCAVFEPSRLGGGVAHHEALVRAIEPRLDLMPRYRQKLAFVPLSLDTPVWVDDADFDIRNHVVRAALPAPGGDLELQQFAGRVYSRPLDRGRPLWELYVVEGLEGGRWALLTKTHHAMVDGISNLELITVLFDVEARVPDPAEFGVSTWQAGDQPTGLGLLVRSLRDRAASPGRAVSAARAVLGNPRQLATALRDTASGTLAVVENSRTPRSVINGRTGPTRNWTFSRFPLADFRAIRAALGGTINDAVVTVMTGGLRRFLITRGVDPAEEQITALCPVSLRSASEKAALGNRLAMLLVPLPVGEPDPVRRMAAVRATIDRLKERKQAVGADFLLSLVGFAPATLHALASRASIRAIGFNTVITNVPGPQLPLYCLGSRLLEAFPVGFLYAGQHIFTAIFSYDGALNFGYLGDAQAVPDLDVLADGVAESLAELLEAARAQAGGGAAQVRPVKPAPKRLRRTSPGTSS